MEYVNYMVAESFQCWNGCMSRWSWCVIIIDDLVYAWITVSQVPGGCVRHPSIGAEYLPTFNKWSSLILTFLRLKMNFINLSGIQAGIYWNFNGCQPNGLCYTTPSSQEVMGVGQAPNPYLRLLALSVSCLPFWSLFTTCIRRLRSD
jgi:hypothetical protein